MASPSESPAPTVIDKMPLTLRIVLLAMAYGVAGILSLQIAIPPGYAAPLYPPSGIALAALLIYGMRMWPGVLLGSLLVQGVAAYNSHLHGAALIGPMIVPLGAVCQAVLAAHLARRLIAFPDPLDSQRAILRFLLIVAPAAGAISTAIAIPALLACGALPPSDALFNAWNWWVGDTLGIVVCVPLMFALFGQPRQDWRPRMVGIALPLLVALAALAFAFVQVRDWEADRLRTQFNRDAENLAHQVAKRFTVQLDMMLALERLMTVSESVTREDWRLFVMPWLERYPGTQNFGWSPYITRFEREAFEQAIRANDMPGFQIRARDSSGHTFAAPQADEYLPILFIEPTRSNDDALGLNPLSLPATAAAIAATRVSGQPRATDAIHLVQEQGNQRGIVVYQAVFYPSEHGRGTLRGVISGVLRMEDAIAAAVDLPRSNIELCLLDTDGAPGNQRLSGNAECGSAAWRMRGLSTQMPLPFAGRQWRIELRAMPAYMSAGRTWAVWTTLAVGLCMVGMLGAFLLATTGRTRRIEDLVAERTTQLAHAGEQLAAQRAELLQAQRIAGMGSWEMTPDGVFSCSAELRRILDLPESSPMGWEDLLARFRGEQQNRLQQALADARAEARTVSLDCTRKLVDGRPQVLLCQIESEWEDGALMRVRGTMQNVTAAREADAHIHFLARFDALTGLPNRMHWIERAGTMLTAAQRHHDRAAVLFLDLDHFKTVNDSLGHPMGDRMLTTVARRLSDSLREEDLLGRLGGDEFVILLPRLQQANDAGLVADKLISTLNEPLIIDQQDLNASASIGIALFPEDGTDVDTLLKHADVAMYGAKQSGRNTYRYFVPAMNERANERLKLETALRRAIERQELVLHYQPQQDIGTSRISACEALVRWQHPERGLLAPMQFVPMAEESGLIHSLGDWILSTACRQQARWAEVGLDLTIAVNISALQFQQSDFAERVAAIVRETGARPHRIELEITESALMTPTDELIARLNRIGAQGIRLALDDFGTGYSSLAYLKRLPIERLKLDRSFVRDLPGDPEDAAIAAATLSLARNLGMEVVAEGVETRGQRDFLALRGCHALQGYFISKPLTAEAMEAWLRTINATP
ncbi:MAG: EAL domain-containing protein [Rhodocyclaceae bacterium]